MSLINKTNFLSKYLKDVAIFLKYSSREKLFVFFAVALSAIAVVFVVYVGYRFLFKVALARPVDETILGRSIKVLMPFYDTPVFSDHRLR